MVNILEFQNLVYKYHNRGIFVDTVPLLVYIVGKYKPSELKNVGSYNEEDYKILASFLNKFNTIIITPYIIAELSNLINTRLNPFFKEMIIGCVSVLKTCYERRLEKDKIINRKEAQWLGFPDVSILIASENKNSLVLSKDRDLIKECEKLGIDFISFDSLRTIEI